MTQMTQKALNPSTRVHFPLGHSPKNHDPSLTQMTQKTTYFSNNPVFLSTMQTFSLQHGRIPVGSFL